MNDEKIRNRKELLLAVDDVTLVELVLSSMKAVQRVLDRDIGYVQEVLDARKEEGATSDE